MVAIHSLQSKYYHWPVEDECNAFVQQIQQKFLFPNCIGLIDGTLNPFTYEPQMEDVADYSRCKYGYSLSTLVVCDDMHCIMYCVAGWPGSAHDNRVFCNSHMYQNSTNFFTHWKYLLGDSAYECCPFIVSAYKKPQGSSIPCEQEMFNMALSKAWVESEHMIGMWKGRFPWLHSILMIMKQFTQKHDLPSVLEVINACVILHNFLIEQNEEILDNWMNDEASDINDAMSDMDELNLPLGAVEPNNQRHKQPNLYINENYI